MNSIQKIESWADQHHPLWLDYLRVLLGIVLIVKGISYVVNNDEVMNMIAQKEYWVIHYAIAHYVIGGYIVCGILIIAGLFFRIAVLFELPALFGSIIFIDIHKDFFAINSELVYSFMILALLIFFFFYGPGKRSVDYYIQTHKDKDFDLS